MKEAVDVASRGERSENKRFLGFAALAYFFSAELGAIGDKVTKEAIAALKNAEEIARIGETALEQKRYSEAISYLEGKLYHHVDLWHKDIIAFEGKIRALYIDVLCHECTNLCDGLAVAIEIVRRELGDAGTPIFEFLEDSKSSLQHSFYRAVSNIKTNAFIHPIQPDHRLQHCKNTGTIPLPMIKKMMAEEAVVEHGGW